ncbi:MAG: SPFH domain-containing protein [Deltaproteobacteria bacterium]|nr:MAG: SPFH domain-containing protein [Deltaproteobacteria bacterium]
MGIMDKLRAELVDVIEWIDDGRRTLVWRFPRYHNQIKHGAQLIVRPGQMAVFVHQGRIADVFGPGQHRLETRNLPVLSTLGGWMYGFDSPFKAEVYFVSTRQVTDLRWGTPNPVPMRDRELGPVRVRAFGTYTLRAIDPKRLLTELVGTSGEYAADEIHELVRSIINQSLADVVAKAELGVLELAAHYPALSEQVRLLVHERIDDEYGLEIPQLVIVNISVPAEVEQALDARASMGVLGDLAAYQHYQVAVATPVAAANPAGGLAGAGVGVGMGLAIAGRFAPGAGPSGAAPPPPPPAAWHIVENGQAVGPWSVEQLSQGVAAGRVGPDTLVWCAGMPSWAAARSVPALAPLFGGPPPLPR